MQFSKNIMVGLNGLEPSTSRLSGARSNHLSYEPIVFSPVYLVILHPSFTPLPAAGGDDGIRTHDPLLAGQVLSQLSYTPVREFCLKLFLFFECSVLSNSHSKLNNNKRNILHRFCASSLAVLVSLYFRIPTCRIPFVSSRRCSP